MKRIQYFESASHAAACPRCDSDRRAGFTMAELLVVVAIIAALVAVAIPVFSAQLEKSRRAVDLSNSRDVVAALKVGYMSGDISFPNEQAIDGRGQPVGKACVVILSTSEGLKYYASGNVLFGGNNYQYDQGKGDYYRVKEYLASCGINADGGGFATKASVNGSEGWAAWAVIMFSDGSSRLISYLQQPAIGTGNGELESWAAAQLSAAESNIERAYGGQG